MTFFLVHILGWGKLGGEANFCKMFSNQPYVVLDVPNHPDAVLDAPTHTDSVLDAPNCPDAVLNSPNHTDVVLEAPNCTNAVLDARCDTCQQSVVLTHFAIWTPIETIYRSVTIKGVCDKCHEFLYFCKIIVTISGCNTLTKLNCAMLGCLTTVLTMI